MAAKPYIELSLYKGFDNLGGGISSGYESAPVIIDLLNVAGFSVKEDGGWAMAYPQTKQGAIYMDSPFENGAQLAAAADQNITETLRLTSNAATPNGRHYLTSLLGQMRLWARQQYTTDFQTDPVYLKLWAFGAPGPQYSRIYDIAIAPNKSEVLPGEKVSELTITITREPRWRWHVPPGATPKLWTIYKSGSPPSTSNITLKGTSNQLFTATIYNQTIQDAGGNYVFKSFVDIPAPSIPGDLPALCQLYINPLLDGNPNDQHPLTILVARRSGVVPSNTLPSNTLAVDAIAATYTTTLGTDASYELDKGTVDDGQATPDFTSSHYHRLKVAFTTTAYASRLQWKILSPAYNGTYAVYARCLQSGGAQDDVKMYLNYGAQNYSPINTPEVSPLLQTVGTDTEYWPLVYMGVIRLPIDNATILQDTSKNGLAFATHELNLYAKRITATGTPTLYMSDLILMPIEEDQTLLGFEAAASALGTGFTLSELYLDSTDYLSRGRDAVIGIDANTGDLKTVGEITGGKITLQPGVNNRLYFLWTSNQAGAAVTLGRSSTVLNAGNANRSYATLSISGNIVPCSSGVRDS